ncbi:FAD-dependent oxidoreductase [Hyalangium minutum]|uniref:3-oxosteroid 1-dehydrogenase n=1 Tax=Hyalangium minutum TaxID=394096 RepID=A0A085WC88_9BACT|nr:FAD-dependent oxidoreductase [Hyalangium minutum]KFE65301.1 3-oxosteroid 1-dehydrogenase [Hyalangium minutum]
MPQWDHRADVVVVGSGGAACAAAAAAVDRGASVVMLEAADTAGGTTRRSGGAYWIPNNSLMRAQGFTDPRADALKLMARLAYPTLYDPDPPRLGLPKLQYDLLAAFYDNASSAIDRLRQLGALDPIILPNYGYSPNPVTDPDYFAELPENKAPYGRVLTAKSPPGSTEFPGLYLSEGMLQHLRSRNVPILLGHRVTDVLRNGRGEVIGVEAEHDGCTRFIRAKRGVVFGSGGFAHDRDKLRSHLRGPIFGSCSVTTSQGAFVDIGGKTGAELGNLSNGFYYQAALEDPAAHEGYVVRPDAHVFFPYGDSTILVNKYGQRVVNEKSPYHVRTQSHFHWRQTEYPNLVQFMIWDQWTANEPTFWPWRGVVPLPGQSSPLVIQAATLEQLAQRISARLDAMRGLRFLSSNIVPNVRLSPDFVSSLRATLQRFNTFAATGVDLDFHRGETPLERAWQGPSRSTTGNRTMYPLSPNGPFYCAILGAATLDTCGGPVIGTNAQVLRPDSTPIPGLYGAGNCIASPTGQAYWGAGGTLGPAITFGFIAGRSAASAALLPD